jgi:hypothetical protein
MMILTVEKNYPQLTLQTFQAVVASARRITARPRTSPVSKHAKMRSARHGPRMATRLLSWISFAAPGLIGGVPTQAASAIQFSALSMRAFALRQVMTA